MNIKQINDMIRREGLHDGDGKKSGTIARLSDDSNWVIISDDDYFQLFPLSVGKETILGYLCDLKAWQKRGCRMTCACGKKATCASTFIEQLVLFSVDNEGELIESIGRRMPQEVDQDRIDYHCDVCAPIELREDTE